MACRSLAGLLHASHQAGVGMDVGKAPSPAGGPNGWWARAAPQGPCLGLLLPATEGSLPRGTAVLQTLCHVGP